MINVFVPNAGRLVAVRDCGVAMIPADAVWIDCLRPTREEDLGIEAVIGVSLPTREEMEEIEPSSRLSVEDGAFYLTAAILCRADSSNPTTTAITFVLTSRHLVTVRYDEPSTITMASSRLAKANGAATPCAVLATLLDAAIDRAADVIEQTSGRIEAISRHIFALGGPSASQVREDHRVTLTNVGLEGIRLGHISESLVSLSRLLNFVSARADEAGAAKVDRAAFKTMQRDVDALRDHIHGLEDRVTFLLDATLGLISIQQNDIIKIFSVLAVVFMPPTLVASIYGMNFDVMPETHWHYGYPMALGIMVAAVALTFAVFRWRRWL